SWTASEQIGGTPGSSNLDASTPIEVVDGPAGAVLRPAYPDPFADRTTIGFELDVPAQVRLVVTDLLGRRVRMLLDAWHGQGVHTVDWDAEGVASGIYFVSMEVNGEPRGRARVTVVR